MGFFGKLFNVKTKVNVRARFELLKEAISGTMSSFYQARDRSTGEVVGLKILDREKTGHSFKRDDSTEVLTSREREVIQLLAEGKTSKEVAVALNLSVKTAETHRTNLMRKLGLHSVADLTRYAVRNGIVQVF